MNSNKYLIYILAGELLFVLTTLSLLFITDLFKSQEVRIFAVLTFVSVLPMLVYSAFSTEDDGKKFGFVGYYLTKLLRRLK